MVAKADSLQLMFLPSQGNPMNTKLAFFVAAIVLCWTSSTSGYISMPGEPVAHKVAVADCVVHGKITAIQPKTVPGQVWRSSPIPKWEFNIVEVEVLEAFYGPKDVKKVRFGFLGSLELNPQ